MPDTRSTHSIALPSLRQVVLLILATAGLYIFAGDVLERFHRESLPLLQRQQAERKLVIDRLVDQGAAAVPQLIAMLGSPDATTRHDALVGLERLDRAAGKSVAAVRESLTDSIPEVREYALITLARISDDTFEVARRAAAMLADPDRDVRTTAARRLEASGAAAIVPVIEMAGSDRPAARVLVVQILKGSDRGHDPTRVSEALRALLRDPDPVVETAAIEAVVGRGAAEVDDLRAWLKSGSPTVVVQALRGVIALGQEAVAVLPELEALLESDDSPQYLVAEALGSMQGAARPVLEKLVERAGQLSGRDRLEAARALLEIGPEPDRVVKILDPLLTDPSERLSGEAGRLLIQAAPVEAQQRVSRLLADIVGDGNSPGPAALQELSVLGPCGRNAVPHLVRLLSNPAVDVRVYAIQTLVKCGADAESAVPVLQSALESPQEDARVKENAIVALGAIGPAARTAVPTLLRITVSPLSHAAHPRRGGTYPRGLAFSAICALGRIGDDSPDVLATLSKLLTLEPSPLVPEEVPQLRAAAIQALVRLKGSADSTAVIVDRLLDSPYWIVRTQAALAIVHLPAGRNATTRHLERMLHDPEPVVQSAVALALGFIGSDAEPAIPTLRDLAGDPRNIVPNRFRSRVAPPKLDFVPGDADLMRLSVAAAARSALTAIESADGSPRPDQKSDDR